MSGDAPDGPVESQRLFDAPRPVVFRAFSDPAVLATNSFHEFDFRPGGAWRFLMRGPDGSEFEMEKRTATFTEEGNGTRVSWRMEFQSAEDLEEIRPFLLEANEQNFDRLAACLAASVDTAPRPPA